MVRWGVGLLCLCVSQGDSGSAGLAYAVRVWRGTALVARASRRAFRYWIAGAFLLVVVAGVLLGLVPHLAAGIYVLASLASYGLYAKDKASARRNGRRTAENTLHVIDVVGGWPGALVAQHQFRHKTMKGAFQVVFWLTVLVNLAVVAWVVSGFA